jgi:hypothetical protein
MHFSPKSSSDEQPSIQHSEVFIPSEHRPYVTMRSVAHIRLAAIDFLFRGVKSALSAEGEKASPATHPTPHQLSGSNHPREIHNKSSCGSGVVTCRTSYDKSC